MLRGNHFVSLLVVNLALWLAPVALGQNQENRDDTTNVQERTEKKAELTSGQKKAIAHTVSLSENVVAVYSGDGSLVKKITVHPDELPKSLAEYVEKLLCEDPRPIDGCVVCKDGTIICSTVKKWKAMGKKKTPEPLRENE